jgi:hypothetical protein
MLLSRFIQDLRPTSRTRYSITVPSHHNGVDLHFIPRTGSKNRMVFETDESDRVVLIRAGRQPEVNYIEGCA